MKILVALLTGSLFVSGDLPSPGNDECVIIDVVLQYADQTMIDPTPVVTGMQLIEYCGHQVTSSTGTPRTERAFKYVDVDLDTAQTLVDGADDLLSDGDVFMGNG